MHDGIHGDKAGIPSITICTDAFTDTSRAMAGIWGIPDYPVIITPHPIASLDKKELRRRAEGMINQIISILTTPKI